MASQWTYCEVIWTTCSTAETHAPLDSWILGCRAQTSHVSLINIIEWDLSPCSPLILSAVQMASLSLAGICRVGRHVFHVLIQGGQGSVERRQLPVAHFSAFLQVAVQMFLSPPMSIAPLWWTLSCCSDLGCWWGKRVTSVRGFMPKTFVGLGAPLTVCCPALEMPTQRAQCSHETEAGLKGGVQTAWCCLSQRWGGWDRLRVPLTNVCGWPEALWGSSPTGGARRSSSLERSSFSRWPWPELSFSSYSFVFKNLFYFILF